MTDITFNNHHRPRFTMIFEPSLTIKIFQLCLLMRDISTNVRSEVARVLGLFTDVDPVSLNKFSIPEIHSHIVVLTLYC